MYRQYQIFTLGWVNTRRAKDEWEKVRKRAMQPVNRQIFEHSQPTSTNTKLEGLDHDLPLKSNMANTHPGEKTISTLASGRRAAQEEQIHVPFP